nr:hypothetical protein [Bacilli bacterium]
MNLDIMLQALLDQVDDIYTRTKSGEITSVEDMNQNVVGAPGFYIIAEPAIDPAFYNYVTDELNIRLSKFNLLDETVIYEHEVGIPYKKLNAYRSSEKIKNSIINNISILEDIKNIQTGRGSR